MRTKSSRRVCRFPVSSWQWALLTVALVFVLGTTGFAQGASNIAGGVAGQVQILNLAPASPAALIPPPPGATIINFDGTPAPSLFADTTALRNEYAAQGVTFSGPGLNDGLAVLNEGGGFSVTGHTPPNFLAWNTSAFLLNGGIPKGPETLTFSPPASLVQINAGSSFGGTITMEAFNAANASLGVSTFPLTSALQTLKITANGIAKVVITTPDATFGVLDDLAFVAGPVTPRCDLQLNKTTYVNGDTLTANALVTNPGTVVVPIEAKIWIKLPATAPPMSIMNTGADGGVMLAAGFNQSVPVMQVGINSSIPRGDYSFNCRLLDPVTGTLLSEDFTPFQIQ